MQEILVRYSMILEIVGDIIRVQVPDSAYQQEVGPRFNDFAVVETSNGDMSLAQVIKLEKDTIFLQVFRGTKGVSKVAQIRQAVSGTIHGYQRRFTSRRGAESRLEDAS